MIINKQTSWSGSSDWYDSVINHPESYQNRVILPNLLRLLSIKPGEHVLDIGCGQGLFSLALARAGAVVIGIDISRKLISIAKRNMLSAELKNVQFRVEAAQEIRSVAGKSMDTIILIHTIQNMDNINKIFQRIRMTLKDNGRLILVMNHPAFRNPRASSWGYDEAKHLQYRRIDQYMTDSKIKIYMHPGANTNDYTWTFHRPLQYYFKVLKNAGFYVTNIEEWLSHKSSQRGPKYQAENVARKEFPLFLYLEARKML